MSPRMGRIVATDVAAVNGVGTRRSTDSGPQNTLKHHETRHDLPRGVSWLAEEV